MTNGSSRPNVPMASMLEDQNEKSSELVSIRACCRSDVIGWNRICCVLKLNHGEVKNFFFI